MADASHTRSRAQSGFTLVELMVVVLIIGVLLAVAIPTFLGARTRGQDSVARSSLRIAQTAAASLLASGDGDDFDDQSPAAILAEEEPSLEFLDGKVSTGPKALSFVIGDGWGGMAALSESGTCFFLLGRDDGSGAITWTEADADADDLPCGGDSADDAAAGTGALDGELLGGRLSTGRRINENGPNTGNASSNGRGRGRDDAPGLNTGRGGDSRIRDADMAEETSQSVLDLER